MLPGLNVLLGSFLLLLFETLNNKSGDGQVGKKRLMGAYKKEEGLFVGVDSDRKKGEWFQTERGWG